jgi:hypothetical protein
VASAITNYYPSSFLPPLFPTYLLFLGSPPPFSYLIFFLRSGRSVAEIEIVGLEVVSLLWYPLLLLPSLTLVLVSANPQGTVLTVAPVHASLVGTLPFLLVVLLPFLFVILL